MSKVEFNARSIVTKDMLKYIAVEWGRAADAALKLSKIKDKDEAKEILLSMFYEKSIMRCRQVQVSICEVFEREFAKKGITDSLIYCRYCPVYPYCRTPSSYQAKLNELERVAAVINREGKFSEDDFKNAREIAKELVERYSDVLDFVKLSEEW